jgi:DNA polymerase III delta subunit
MVKKEKPVYLFLGQDILAEDNSSLKEKELNKLKDSIPRKTRDFNLDILHCNDRSFSLNSLQEKLLFMAAGDSGRIVVVRNLQDAKPEVKDFIAGYVKNPSPGTILVLDMDSQLQENAFIDSISGYAQVRHFRTESRISTFALSRLIEARKAEESLKTLHQLLDSGEKPERIMGALRASWTRSPAGPLGLKKRLKILLQCDLDIKTGRIKPVFALEKLIVNLCGLRNFSG